MDWQTITTILILTIAAAILLNRVWGILRSGKNGNCESCGGCGESSKSTQLLQLVPLGTGTNSREITTERHGSSDVGAEKTS